MSTETFLVTGGTGVLGHRVVDRLRAAGRSVRILSRSGHPGTVRGDLITGEGIDEALRGAGTIIHCATSPTRTRETDVEGTKRLLRAAERGAASHVVFVSVVGVDRNPYLPYYRMKLETERLLERSIVPWTVLRVSQFHEAVLRVTKVLDRVPVMTVPKGFLFQPIAAGEAADRVVELALSEPAGYAPDICGPEVRAASELARAYFGVVGRRRRVVEVPVPGRMAKAFREGAQLCRDHAYGNVRYEDFLRRTLRTRDADEADRKEFA